MRWSVRVAAIGLLTALTAIPVRAATSEAEQLAIWRWQLRQAYCTQNWTEALSIAGAMMGSEATSEYERIWLFLLRQDMFNYQRDVAEFSGCDGGSILAGVTAEESFASLPDSSASESSLNWTRETEFGHRNQSSLDRSLVARVASSPSNTVTENNRTAASDSCNSRTGERRVANGSVSNQWDYEIWQNSSRSFYIRYWLQYQTCEQARTTSSHPTQNEAWQEFRCSIGLETQLEDYTCNASEQTG